LWLKYMKLEERVTKLENKLEEILQILQPELKKMKTIKESPHAQKMPIKLYAQTLGGLSNPIRIAILNRLATNGAYYHELEKLSGMPSAPLSFHLRALKSSGLIYQDAKRGKYLITQLGHRLLELIGHLATSLYSYETVELNRYCFSCSQAKMKIDVFPTHLQIWCPKCGGDHGSKWSFTLANPFGEEWRLHGVEKLIDAGWQETFRLMKEAIQSNRCINCNAQIEYVFHEDRVEAKCPLCNQHYSARTNDLTPERLFQLWKKHTKMRQKTDGPVEKEGIRCWEITVTDERNKIIAKQYVKVGKGEEVVWQEF